MCSRQLVISILVLPSFMQPLAAQSALPLERGTHVRVVIPPGSRGGERAVAGSLVRLSGDTAVIDSERRSHDVYVLRPDWRLEVRTSGHGHSAEGAAVGALVAGGGLAITTAAVWESCSEDSRQDPVGFLGCSLFEPKGLFILMAGVFGALAGAGLGAIIGDSIRHEEWEPVSTTGVRVGVVASPRGAGLGVRWAF